MGKSDAKSMKSEFESPAAGLLLLALSYNPFLKKVQKFRHKHGIKVPFVIRTIKDAKKIEGASRAFSDFMRESRLPLSVRHFLWNYVMYGELETGGAARYRITSKPRFTMNAEGENITYADSVSLVTYARLSSAEERVALKDLRQWQKIALHPSALRSSKAISRARENLPLEKAMKSRTPLRTVEQPASIYLSAAMKKFLSGRMSKEEFDSIKARNPHGMEKVRTGRTSKDIALELFGSEDKKNVARTRLSRLNKARKKLFGY